MRGNLNLILSDNIIKLSFYASIIIIIFQIVLILITLNRLPPLIPLLNSQPWGAERLAPSLLVIVIPFILAAVFTINNFLSLIYYKKNTLAARILSFNAFLFIFLGFLAYIQIVLLVF
jgi:hypothetical protein